MIEVHDNSIILPKVRLTSCYFITAALLSTAFYYKNVRIEKHHLFSPLIFILLTSDGVFPLTLKKCYDALVRAMPFMITW
jgi:hypothetical protein